jgi:hypothetical protein
MIIARATSQKLPSFTRQETKEGEEQKESNREKANSCPWVCSNPIPFLLMELTSSLHSNRISTITNYPILFAANGVSMYIIILDAYFEFNGFNEAVD